MYNKILLTKYKQLPQAVSRRDEAMNLLKKSLLTDEAGNEIDVEEMLAQMEAESNPIVRLSTFARFTQSPIEQERLKRIAHSKTLNKKSTLKADSILL